MGNNKEWLLQHDRVLLLLPKGTTAKIRDAHAEKSSVSDYIRRLVEADLKIKEGK